MLDDVEMVSWWVFFRIQSYLTFKAKIRLDAATFMSVLGDGDVIYMNTSSQSHEMLDTVTIEI